MRDLHDILAEFRSAIERRAAGEGAVWGGLVACAVLVVAAAVFGWLTQASWLRWAIWTVAAFAASAGVVVGWWRARRAFPDEQALAAYLESQDPRLRTDVRTALEWERLPSSDDDAVTQLRHRLIARVNGQANVLRAKLDEWTPRRSLRRPLIGMAALLVLGGTLTAAVPSYGAGARALIFGATTEEDGDTVVATRPLVSTVDFEITPPSYLPYPTRRIRRSTGDVQALVGSEVHFAAEAMLPITAAVLRVEQGGETTRTQLTVTGERNIAGQFTVSEDATYRFEVWPIAGRDEWASAYVEQHGDIAAVDPLVREIDAIPDKAPSVELLTPQEHVEVTPDQIVNFEYIARDDFGLSAISLVWHFAGDENNPRQLPLQGAVAGTEFQEHVPFDLTPMNLQPRDEVIVVIEAVDNDQFSGAKTGRSRAVALRVASPDDRHIEVLALKEQLFESLLGQLGGMLATGMVDHNLNDAGDGIALVPAQGDLAASATRVAAQKEVHGQWIEVIELFEALLGHMEEDSLSIAADRDMLQGLYDSLYSAILDERRALETITAVALEVGVSRADFEPAAKLVAETLQTTERGILVLEDLVATHKADNVSRAMEELSDVRDRLQELLEQYRDTNDPEVREQIERELRRLEQRMRELMAQLASQVEQLPREHLNAEAIEPSEVAESIGEMQSAMDQIREMLDTGDVDAALDLLQRLEDELSAMDDELQPLGDAQPETLSEFDQSMGELMDELQNLQEMEAAVEADTQALLDEMIAERAAEMQEQSQDVFEQAREAIAEARERVEGAETERMSGEANAVMQGIEEGLALMEELLSEGDAAGAEQTATRLMSQLSDAQWELRREASMLVRDPEGRQQADEAQRAARQADDAVVQTRRAMRQLMEAGRPEPNGAQRQQLQQLSQQQNEVRQRMQQMQGQVDEMSERFPMVGEQLTPTLEQAMQQMESAEGQLQGRDARPALRSEQGARETMQQAQNQMQQLTQRQRQREQRGASGRRPEDEVEISEDGEVGRAAFRQRVVESMRDDTIEAYEAEIRRYYETLLE